MLNVVKPYIESGTNLVILDLGCGNGFGTEIFSTLGNVIGVDISLSSLKRAHEQNNNLRQHFVLQDINSLGFKSDSFDVIICLFDVPNYIDPKKIKETIVSIKRSLKIGGLIGLNFLTPQAFQDLDKNPDTISIGDDYFFLSKVSGIASSQVALELFAFIKEDNKESFRLVRENHTLFIYRIDHIVEILERAGLEILSLTDGESLDTVDYGKTWNAMVIAKKV